MEKRALITGITGQDGSYLAELLLEKGYKVYAIVRRLSTPNYSRIKHILDKIEIIDGDLCDQASLNNAVQISKPDEVYNLAAQSFVETSWKQPILTGEVSGLGTTRLLEAVRQYAPQAKFYQASTSEMYGNSHVNGEQTESTPFHPRSPYAIAKLYSHWIAVNYRESYGMFVSCGILFNHECLTYDMPVIIKQNGFIDIKPIGEIVPHRKNINKNKTKVTTDFSKRDMWIWDGKDFTKILCGTATRNKYKEKTKAKPVKRIVTGKGIVELTDEHIIFDDKKKEIKAKDVKLGDKLKVVGLPKIPNITKMTKEFAWLLGAFVGDGSATYHGSNLSLKFVNSNKEIYGKFKKYWKEVACGTCSEYDTKGGFKNSGMVHNVVPSGNPIIMQWIAKECYTEDGLKRIPKIILNSDKDTALAFLKGYNETDGLKSNKQRYEFKRFKTNSLVLAMGLYWLASQTLKQDLTIQYECKKDGRFFCAIDLLSPNNKRNNNHLKKDQMIVKQVKDIKSTDLVFDLATESGTYHAGVGRLHMHNSPRRGIEFVTRKITDGVARIKLGLAESISLGNLDSKRDWGFAGDYVRAMWLMLQQDTPKDYVISTGESHSVREFLDAAFGAVGITEWEQYVKQDPRFMRPAELHTLQGRCDLAKQDLGWIPEVSFKELVEMMVKADIERLKNESTDHRD